MPPTQSPAPSPRPSPRWGRGRYGAGSRGRRIGLLGGSFNPAHGGHLHISRLALTRLGLDEIWWLVSPQNPLKPAAGMAPFAERLRQAAEVAAADRAHPGQRHRGPARHHLHRRHAAGAAPAFSARPIRLADGWRQPRAIPILASLAGHFPHRPDRRFRPSRQLVEGAGRRRRASFCPARALPVTAARRLAEMHPAGLGVFPYPARPPLGHADPGRATVSHRRKEKRPDVMPELTAVATLHPAVRRAALAAAGAAAPHHRQPRRRQGRGDRRRSTSPAKRRSPTTWWSPPAARRGRWRR